MHPQAAPGELDRDGGCDGGFADTPLAHGEDDAPPRTGERVDQRAKALRFVDDGDAGRFLNGDRRVYSPERVDPEERGSAEWQGRAR